MLISAGDLFFAYVYINISLKSLSGHAIKWLFVSVDRCSFCVKR